jgi:hypothetical protein
MVQESAQGFDGLPESIARVFHEFPNDVKMEVQAYETDREKRRMVEEHVATNFPTPMAMLFKVFREDAWGKVRDPLTTCKVMLDFFWLLTQYFTYLSFVSYCRTPEIHNDKVEKALRDLQSVENFSFGHWWGMLRDSTRCFSGDNRDKHVVPELVDFYFKTGGGKTHKYVKVFEAIPTFRNRVLGHTLGGPKQSQTFVKYFRAYFYFLLEKWLFLESYTLFTPLIPDDKDEEHVGCFAPRIECFRGERPCKIDVITRSPLKKHHFYLFRNGDGDPNSWAYDSGRILEDDELIEISPFLFFDTDDKNMSAKEVYLQFQHTLSHKKTNQLVGIEYQMADRDLDIALERELRRDDGESSMVELVALMEQFFLESLKEGEEGIVRLPDEPERPAVDGSGISWEHLIEACRLTSDRHLRNIVRGRAIHVGEDAESVPDLKYDSELYVNRDEVESAFESFLQSQKSGFVLVGASGMGKTCVICHLYERMVESGHLMLFLNSSNLDSDLNLEREILGKVASTATFEDTLCLVNDECERRGGMFVIFIDAINEFRTDDKTPLDLAKKIDRLIAENTFPRVKFVMTSRLKIWQTIMNNYDFRISETDYFLRGPGQVYSITPFSDNEVITAFEKYRTRYRLATPYDDLSEALRTTLSDPLMLRFVSEVYEGRQVPRTVETSVVFDEYFNRKVYDRRNDVGDVALRDLVFDIARCMLELEKDSVTAVDIERLASPWRLRLGAIDREVALSEERGDHARREELMIERHLPDLEVSFYDNVINTIRDDKMESAYVRLLDEGILTEQQRADVRTIKFTYDRFFEFVLTDHLLKSMERVLNPSLRKRQQREELVRFVADLVPTANRFNTLWGALQGLLISFHNGKLLRFTRSETLEPVPVNEFNRFIAELAQGEDVAVLSLIAAALEKLALADMENFSRITEELWSDDMDPGEGSDDAIRQRAVSKMLLDTAYTILISDSHRSLYLDLEESEQRQHREVLYTVFRRGMQSSPGSTSDTACQYLYYLWKYDIDDSERWPYYKQHAENVLSEISAEAAHNLGRIYNLVVKKHRNSLNNLVGLFALILAENCERPDRIGVLLEDVKLLLKGVQGGLLFKALIHLFNSIGGRVTNTFGIDAVNELLTDPDSNSKARDILEFLDPLARPMHDSSEEDRILELSREPNGMARQLLAHALSSQYSIHPEHQERYIGLLERMFDIRDPVSRFVSSVALYHINYMGKYQSRETLDAFAHQVAVIQQEHKGRLHAPSLDEPANFNIVGEYARSLVAWEAKLAEDPLSREEASAFRASFFNRMDYVTKGLDQAKRDEDLDYYLGLVEDDIALLGVLVPPRKALELVKYVLEDAEILELPDDGREEVPFGDEEFNKIRAAALESLAKIRARYQREVEDFLYAIDRPSLIDEVRRLAPEYDFGIMFSWLFEELFEKILIHYPELGSRVIGIMRTSIDQGSAEAAIRNILTELLNLGQEWVESDDHTN